MTRDEIESILLEDSLSEFAVRQRPEIVDAHVLVRGLKRAGAGSWYYSEVRRPGYGWSPGNQYEPGHRPTVRSRDIISFSVAQIELARAQEAARERYAKNQGVAVLVERLKALGYHARQSGGRVMFEDAGSLERLIGQLESSGKQREG